MSKKKNANTPDELQKVQSALGKSEAFIENNIKQLAIGVLIIAVIVAGIVIFRTQYQAPREARAQEQIFRGEAYFAADSFRVALDGNGVDYIGFKSIIKQYGMTNTANLAKAYAGASYYHLGEYKTALDYLKGFKAKDNLIAPAFVGLTGDCYIELGDVNKAISYFEKAAKQANNDIVSPVFLKKAAIAYESQGKYDKAIAHYNTIKEKYHRSNEAFDIERYIYRAELLRK